MHENPRQCKVHPSKFRPVKRKMPFQLVGSPIQLHFQNAQGLPVAYLPHTQEIHELDHFHQSTIAHRCGYSKRGSC